MQIFLLMTIVSVYRCKILILRLLDLRLKLIGIYLIQGVQKKHFNEFKEDWMIFCKNVFEI